MAYCTACGEALEEGDRFCAQCGTKVRRPASAAERPSAIPDRPADWAPLTSPAGTDVGPPQYGSMLLGASEPPPQHTGARRGWPRRLILPGVLLGAVGVGALVGYWWFGRPGGTGAVSTVDTEQAIGSRSGGEGGDAHTSASGWRVVETFTGAVQHPAAAEGVPDGQTAIIPPGDSLALEWIAGEFYNGEGPDVRIVGLEGTRTRYTIFARTDPSDQWVRFDINTRGFPGGAAAHDFGHHGIEAARELLIRNEGTGNLPVDAVVPLYTEPQAHAEESHAHS
ncbi:MAG TPA: zinc ribbon domain-containing protein [Vicinamibacterales bacterium]